MPAANQYSSLGDLSQKDLEDKNLFTLNNHFRFLEEQVAALQGGSGTTQFKNGIKTPFVDLGSTNAPTSDNYAVSYGFVKKLIAKITGRGSSGSGSTTIIAVPPATGGYFELVITADTVQIDLANGINHHLVLNQTAQVTVLDPIFTAGTIAAGAKFFLYVECDATPGRPTPAFSNNNPNGFTSDTGQNGEEISGTENTRSIWQFTYHGTLWAPDSFMTGRAIS